MREDSVAKVFALLELSLSVWTVDVSLRALGALRLPQPSAPRRSDVGGAVAAVRQDRERES